jgi:NAD(P)H-flavin reductase
MMAAPGFTAAPLPGVRPRGPSPWKSAVMRVAGFRPEIEGVQTLDLVFRDAADRAAATPFRPGQFNMLCLPGIGECAISIASDPRVAEPIGHTFRAVGTVTNVLAGLRAGDEVILRGPFGTVWPLDALRARDVVIVAGGLGLASMRAAILHLAAHRGDYGSVAVLHGAKTPAGLLFTSEYAAWRKAGIDVQTIVDAADGIATAPGWSGRVGLVPALFDDCDVRPGLTSLLGCGPEPMMQAVVTRGVAAGIGPPDTWLSLERNMACAAGFCGLCQFGPSFVCKDGPVFRHDVIAPFLAVRHL